jgi:hypothetical protein
MTAGSFGSLDVSVGAVLVALGLQCGELLVDRRARVVPPAARFFACAAGGTSLAFLTR